MDGLESERGKRCGVISLRKAGEMAGSPGHLLLPEGEREVTQADDRFAAQEP